MHPENGLPLVWMKTSSRLPFSTSRSNAVGNSVSRLCMERRSFHIGIGFPPCAARQFLRTWTIRSSMAISVDGVPPSHSPHQSPLRVVGQPDDVLPSSGKTNRWGGYFRQIPTSIKRYVLVSESKESCSVRCASNQQHSLHFIRFFVLPQPKACCRSAPCCLGFVKDKPSSNQFRRDGVEFRW